MTYGNIMNRIAERYRSPEPEVGMGATMLFWSDRKAATIVEVSENKMTVVIQRDIAKRTDSNGMSECQDYEYTPDTEAARDTYTLRKNGSWVRKGESLRYGQKLAIGYRNEYYDFSF